MLDLLFTVAIALNPQPTRRTVVATTAAAALLPTRPALAAKSRTDPTYTFRRTPDEWKQQLSEMQYFVLREGGTESPNTSPLYVEKRAGTFRCAGCDSALFASNAKFNSGTGCACTHSLPTCPLPCTLSLREEERERFLADGAPPLRV